MILVFGQQHTHRSARYWFAEDSRDGGCRFPGCTHQRYLDAHHIEHWADGGDTKLSNLVTLCRFHHRRTPYHRENLEHTHTELGIHIDPNTAATRWRGERLDYDLGVWVLCQPHAGASRFETDGDADVSAETFDAEQDVEHDGEWWRHTNDGPLRLGAS